jgi:hypothetical protein
LKAELVILEELQFAKTAFYSLRLMHRDLCEFDDFTKRMRLNPKTKRQLGELNRIIQSIGTKYGATDEQFKRENYAERLPSPTHRFFDSDGENEFGIRLYCVRVSDEVVILLNGDMKTSQRTFDCPRCKPHFDLANAFSNAFYLAKKQEKVGIEGKEFLFEDDDFLFEL